MAELIFINQSKNQQKHIFIFEQNKMIESFSSNFLNKTIFLSDNTDITIIVKNKSNKLFALLHYLFFASNGIANHNSILESLKYEKLSFVSSANLIIIDYVNNHCHVVSNINYSRDYVYNKRDGCLLVCLLLLSLFIIYYSVFNLLIH